MNLFEKEIKNILERTLDHYNHELNKAKIRLEETYENSLRGIAALDSEIASLQAERRAELVERSAV